MATVIADMSMSLDGDGLPPPTTVKAIAENGLPWRATRRPATPLTRTGWT